MKQRIAPLEAISWTVLLLAALLFGTAIAYAGEPKKDQRKKKEDKHEGKAVISICKEDNGKVIRLDTTINLADEAAIEAQIPEMEDFARADRDFFVATLRGVIGQHERLTALVAAHIDRPFNELSPIEACVLLMGAHELADNPETPYRVIINEAIELTKSFGGTDGHKYVNAVLNGLAPRLRANEVAADKAAGKPGPEAAAAEGEGA